MVEIGHWLWVPRQWKHGQPQGKKLLYVGVMLSVSEGPRWPFTALGHLKAGQEGGLFPACAILTGAPDWPGLGQGQIPLETAS